MPAMTFREGDSRIGNDQTPNALSFAIRRHMAMNLPTQAMDRRAIREMRKVADWNYGFVYRVLRGVTFI